MFQIGLIFTNFISWIKFNKKMFFILLINLSLVAGVIIYLFSFNNNLIYSKVTTIRHMTYGRTYTVQGEMDADEVYGTVDNFINNDKLPEIEFAYFSGMPDIGGKKGKATAVNFYKDEIKGHYYDEKYDINDSGKVALATDTNINVLYGTDLNKDTKSININGKYYTVEYTKEQFIDSMEHLAGLVLVRLSYDDFSGNISPITEFIIVFEERLDEVQEKAFRSEIRKLKNLEQIIVQPKETSDKKNYKIEMIIDTVLLLAAMMCLMEIYGYVLNSRKKEFAVYRICGAGKNFILKVLIVEILFLTLTGFFVGTAIFLFAGYLTGAMRYIYFNMGTWIKALIIVLLCMGTVAGRLALKLNSESLTDVKKGAMVK